MFNYCNEHPAIVKLVHFSFLLVLKIEPAVLNLKFHFNCEEKISGSTRREKLRVSYHYIRVLFTPDEVPHSPLNPSAVITGGNATEHDRRKTIKGDEIRDKSRGTFPLRSVNTK